MKKFFVFIIVIMSTLSLSAKDYKVLVVTTTPQMHCASCEARIKSNLRFEKGVKKIETDVKSQKVTITYDPKKTTPERLIKGFGKFKYAARVVKPGEVIKTNTDEDCPVMPMK